MFANHIRYPPTVLFDWQDGEIHIMLCKFLQDYCIVYCELYTSRGYETLLFKVQQRILVIQKLILWISWYFDSWVK